MRERHEPHDRARNPSRLWYGAGAIDRWFYGVFEGGAAAAMAYPGALEAMAAGRAWFCSVAGASAGAITAAFIASGARADAAAQFAVEMFELIDVRGWAGIRRLYRDGAYFPSEQLLAWLDEQLAAQLGPIVGGAVPRPVDFATLFEVSGIELFIVATNLSLNREIVFSHLSTPECSVAEAAVASSAAPLVFASRLLEVPAAGEQDRATHHTIVDGGLWSNFPMFVYADAGFRRDHGARPLEIGADRIIGLLLDADQGAELHHRAGVRFYSHGELNALEWSLAKRPGRSPLWCRLAAPVLAVPAFIARALDRTQPLNRGRWPVPSRACVRHAGDAVNALFGVLSPLWVAAIVWTFVAAVAVAGAVSWVSLLERASDTPWPLLMSWVAFAVFVVPLLLLLLFGLVANAFLLRPMRRVLYGMIKTYLAAGGSRSWEAAQPNVVRLPVPETLSPFDFRDAVRRHAAMIAAAREAMERHLERRP